MHPILNGDAKLLEFKSVKSFDLKKMCTLQAKSLIEENNFVHNDEHATNGKRLHSSRIKSKPTNSHQRIKANNLIKLHEARLKW